MSKLTIKQRYAVEVLSYAYSTSVDRFSADMRNNSANACAGFIRELLKAKLTAEQLSEAAGLIAHEFGKRDRLHSGNTTTIGGGGS